MNVTKMDITFWEATLWHFEWKLMEFRNNNHHRMEKGYHSHRKHNIISIITFLFVIFTLMRKMVLSMRHLSIMDSTVLKATVGNQKMLTSETTLKLHC